VGGPPEINSAALRRKKKKKGGTKENQKGQGKDIASHGGPQNKGALRQDRADDATQGSKSRHGYD